MDNSDLDVLEFIRKVSILGKQTPKTDLYDEKHGKKDDKYFALREKIIIYGLYQPINTKKMNPEFIDPHSANTSASKMYNSIGRPEMLLWLAEAVGIEDSKLDEIIEILESGAKQNKRANTLCSWIREKITFKDIMDNLND